MNITVYCGSKIPENDLFVQAAKELGAFIGENGHPLVYGGADTGLMGIMADTVLENGGRVIGVYPKNLEGIEGKHPGLTEFYMTENIPERRSKMIELGDVFVALPGGPGTFEEMSEIISLVRIDQLDGKFVGLNIDGYYGELIKQFDKMLDERFITPEERSGIVFVNSVVELEKKIYDN